MGPTMKRIKELEKSNREMLEQIKKNRETLKRSDVKLEELVNDSDENRGSVIIQALDVVQLENGATGVVNVGNENGCSISWFGNIGEKTAWWQLGEKGLKKIDTLPSILGKAFRGPHYNNGPYDFK